MGTKRVRLLAVLALLIALVVVAIAARSTGTKPFSATATHGADAEGPSRTRQPPITVVGTGENTRDTRHNPPGTDWKQVVLIACLIALAGWIIWRIANSTWSPWRAAAVPKHAGLDMDDDPAAPRELRRALDQSIEFLDRGPVGDAIIACWVRVEDATANVGITIRRTETSSEFVDRVLGSYGAREEALRRMSELYREARFSSHVMDETARGEARHCLTDIQTDLAGRRAQT